MNKTFLIVTACTITIIGFFYYYIVKFSPDIKTPDDAIVEKIELLSNKVDSIRKANDSIRVIIDTTEIKIEHVYEKYIQVREHIITQSVDSDCVFFSDYLSSDSKRFIDTINFVPAETY
jgi:hypothetical protein